jgi:hypothetical protein
LLALLGLVRPPLELSSRREPYFGPSNVIDLERERMRRMPIMAGCPSCLWAISVNSAQPRGAVEKCARAVSNKGRGTSRALLLRSSKAVSTWGKR